MGDEQSLSENFLRAMLEHYVLHCLGQLEPEWSRKLTENEERLAVMFKSTGHWYEMIETRMGFGAGLADSIRELWERSARSIRATGANPDAREFARQMVADNFFRNDPPTQA